MGPSTGALVAAVLRAFAELSPAPSSGDLVAARREDLAMTGSASPMGFLAVEPQDEPLAQALRRRSAEARGGAPPYVAPIPASARVERLARLDALHADEQLLRHGWVIVVGTTDIDGERRRVLQPLVSQPVRIRRQSVLTRTANLFADTASSEEFVLTALGEVEGPDFVEDPQARAEIVEAAQFGGGGLGGGLTIGTGAMRVTEQLIQRMPKLLHWVRTSAAAGGLPVGRVLPGTEDPWDWIDRRGLVAIAGDVIYLTRQVHAPSLRNTLLNWASRPSIDRSAFAAMLGAAPAPALREEPATVESPLVLSSSQAAVVRRARGQRLTVVSGPPGSGKSHTVSALALDAVAAGRSVLVATQSRYAADVVTGQLHDAGGPEPVRFGSGAGIGTLIDDLVSRQERPIERSEIRALDRELELARLQVDALRTGIASDLCAEVAAMSAQSWDATIPLLVQDAPGVFDLDSDLDAIDELLARDTDPGAVIARWGARRRRRRIARLARARPGTSTERIGLAVEAARSRRIAARLASQGGTLIGERWEQLHDAEDRLRRALARRQRAAAADPAVLDRAARAAIGQLLTALRSGRARRREVLAEMDPGQLTAAAALWVGTLGEIEDVLPATAGLFDVVILDEASQIDQIHAAPALLRGRDAVVVGDPLQLRHVSFLGDRDVDAALRAHGLERWSGLLDVRRTSAYDLAASVAPVDVLREHFRSAPHLIDFSVRAFYRDRVDVMTRHPRNEDLDCIDVVHVEPPRAGASVHQPEIDAVLELVRKLEHADEGSVGVVTPFRDQADALERALAEELDDVRIDAMSLRVGTVHSFQGGERDVVVISLGLSDEDPPGRRSFVEDPHLFNVMVTRARQRVIVVTSLSGQRRGLVSDYLRHAEHPPAATAAESLPGWAGDLARELRASGVAVRERYPVGPWSLDLCCVDPPVTYLECGVDPRGAEATIERRMTLRRLGWSTLDAYPSRWDGDAIRAALDLRAELSSGGR